MNLTDERHLNDVYNMSIMIAKMKASHQQYNMCDMFTIVFPLSEGSRTLEDKHLDLYTQYEEITEEEVAASCEWYNKWTAKEYYCDNLTLTFKHLENNMTHKLFDKCFERYDTYPLLNPGVRPRAGNPEVTSIPQVDYSTSRRQLTSTQAEVAYLINCPITTKPAAITN